VWILAELETEPDPLFYFLLKKTDELLEELGQESLGVDFCSIFENVNCCLKRLKSYVKLVSMWSQVKEQGVSVQLNTWQVGTDDLCDVVREKTSEIVETCCNFAVTAMKNSNAKADCGSEVLVNDVVVTFLNLLG